MDAVCDIVIHADGPKARDKLAHGEVKYDEIPNYLSQRIVGLFLTLMMKCDIRNVDKGKSNHSFNTIF